MWHRRILDRDGSQNNGRLLNARGADPSTAP